MSNINDSACDDTTTNNFETGFSRLVKFTIFLPIQLVAVPLSLFIVYELLTKRDIRQSFPNHVIISLNIVALLDIVLQQTGMMAFFQLNHVWPESYACCVFWNYMDFLNYALCLHLTCLVLFQRHVSTFNPRLCHTQRHRLAFYFVPLAAIVIYCVGFYLGIIVFNKCENDFDYTQSWCGDLCFLDDERLYLFDWIVNGLLPSFLIVLLSVTLLLRVIQQKQRVQLPFVWRKYRKLTVQLMAMSSLYTILFLPTIITALTQKAFNDDNFALGIQTTYLDYLPVLGRSVTPFMSLATLPELQRKLFSFVKRFRARYTAVVQLIYT